MTTLNPRHDLIEASHFWAKLKAWKARRCGRILPSVYYSNWCVISYNCKLAAHISEAAVRWVIGVGACMGRELAKQLDIHLCTCGWSSGYVLLVR